MTAPAAVNGALAAGAVAHRHLTVFGTQLAFGANSYLHASLASAGGTPRLGVQIGHKKRGSESPRPVEPTA